MHIPTVDLDPLAALLSAKHKQGRPLLSSASSYDRKELRLSIRMELNKSRSTVELPEHNHHSACYLSAGYGRRSFGTCIVPN